MNKIDALRDDCLQLKYGYPDDNDSEFTFDCTKSGFK
ncbi:unknown [Eggerthella sp. CAG:1427]|nr:unknown [Eggerthella sp. CAG:1427]